MRRCLTAIVYAVASCGLLGGCAFLYLLVMVYLNTSPTYMRWLFGFAS